MARRKDRKKGTLQSAGDVIRSSPPGRRDRKGAAETRPFPIRSSEPGWLDVLSRRDLSAPLILGLLIAVSYFPATRLGFVWDDEIITTLKAIQDWRGLLDLWFAPGTAYRQGAVGEDHYWPLLYTTFWLEHKLWGFAPTGYHVVNLAVHVVNTVLLWRLLQRLSVPGAWWVAAFFAVHPLHVESVAWVIARKDLLSAMFYLAAFMTWVRFIAAPRVGPYLAALALFAAAMLCKSIAVSLPAALLIWHWWKDNRITGTDLLRLLPFFLVGLAIATLDLLFYQRVNLSFDYSMAERTLIAAHALWFYAGKLLWPVPLALLYAHWDVHVTNPLAWGYVVATVAWVAPLWFLRRRIGRGPLACTLFFAVTLAPVLGFVDFGYMNVSFVADRYQYLAGIGVMVLLIGVAAYGVDQIPDGVKTVSACVAWTLLLLLGAATWNQSGIYKDDVTLFSHSAAANPESWAAHHYAATEYFELGRYDEAEDHFRRSLELRPRDESGRNRRNTLQDIAETMRRRGQYDEAVETYRAVLAIDPAYALAHAGLGDVLFSLKRDEEAIAALERSLSLQPDSPMAGALRQRLRQSLDRLAMSRSAEKRYEDALRLYRKLGEINPDMPRNHANLGVTLYHLGRLEEALHSFERALVLEPDLAAAKIGIEETQRALRQRER